MDYNTRIKRLKKAIDWMESADTVKPYFSNEYQNNETKNLSDTYIKKTNQLLKEYQQAYDECIEALQLRVKRLEKTKSELYHYYARELMSLSEEDRKQFLNEAKIDPSVKKILHEGRI